jgi:hypothetical protein
LMREHRGGLPLLVYMQSLAPPLRRGHPGLPSGLIVKGLTET